MASTRHAEAEAPQDPVLVRREDIGDLRLSVLLDAKVVSEDGTELGHVHDLASERTGRESGGVSGKAWIVTHLLVGRRGLLARYGIALRPSRRIAWADVVGMRDRTIVVRDDR